MTRLVAAALLIAVSIGCRDLPWSEVGTGVPLARWFDRGATLYVTPHGLETLAASGPSLLSATLGGGVVVPIAPDDSAYPVMGPPLVLRPATLGLTLDEPSNALLLTVAFLPVAYVATVAGCDVAISFAQPEAHVALDAARDVAGHITLVARQPGATLVSSSESAEIAPGCPAGSEASAAALAAVRAAIQAQLSDPSGLVAKLEALGEALVGARVPRRLDVVVPDPAGTPGRLSVEIAPNDDGGKFPVAQVSSGFLVMPLRVGVDASAAGCVGAMGELPFAKPGALPPPGLPAESSGDVAIAIRRDVLDALMTAFARSGLLCARAGFDDDPPLTLGELAPLLYPDVAPPFPATDRVSVRLLPGKAPSLTFAAGPDVTAALAIPALTMELYVRHWDADWLIFKKTLNVAALGLTLVLESSGEGSVVRLQGGTFANVGAEPGPDDALARIVLDRITHGLSLFALPAVHPYPLVNAHFELQESYLAMTADFDTSGPPDLSNVAAALLAEQTPAAPGCSSGPRPAPAMLVLLLLGVWGSVSLTRAHRGGMMPRSTPERRCD